MNDIDVTYSRGYGKSGKLFAYVRPCFECINRSRRVGAFSQHELKEKIQLCVTKYFTPLKKYMVDGHVIGSNNKQNALKEYRKRCAIEDIKNNFTVDEIV